MQKRSIEVVDSLRLDDLQSPLHPTEIPHPIARNKFEAFDWNIKHTMWHCGQLGILLRIGGERFDFGLRRQQSSLLFARPDIDNKVSAFIKQRKRNLPYLSLTISLLPWVKLMQQY